MHRCVQGGSDPQGPLSATSFESGSNYPLTAQGMCWVCLKASWIQQPVTTLSEVSPVVCLPCVCVYVCVCVQ